jgi:DNA-binding PucR family transcriptional regulator
VAQHVVTAADELAAGRFRCTAGIGPPVGTLEEAWRSHRHAELAARAVPRGVRPGPVVDWADLGAFGPLLRIPEPALDPTAVPPQLDALLQADPRGRLVGTLETYLRHGGSAPAAAKVLHIHRTTLHYRLDRIRDITGCDLDDGETRLLLHLGLKIAHLLGLLDEHDQFLPSEQDGETFPAPGP